MVPRQGFASGPNASERKGRKSSKFDYLPWAVQAKIKRHKVERMMIKRNYYSERNKRASGTGANAGAQDEGWGLRPERPDVKPPDADTNFDDNALALGADRKPVRVPEVSVERPRPRKQKVQRGPSTSPPPPPSQNAPQMPSEKSTKQPHNKSKMSSEQEGASGPRFRDLKREAYSRATLHSHKSSPMHRNRGPQGLNLHRPSSRGQPNMKLRIDVMLEQIKRGAA